MYGTAHTIRRTLRALVLAASAAAFAIPVATAGNNGTKPNDRLVDDWYRDTPSVSQAQALRPQGLTGDYYLRSVNGTQPNDRVVDDWFRDTSSVSQAQALRPQGLAGDYMFRNYFRSLNGTQPTDRVVDDWFRDNVSSVNESPVTAPKSSSDGIGTSGIALGIGASLVALLLLAVLGVGARQAHHRHRLA